MYTIKILGTAVPQGSKSVSRQGYLFDANRNLKAWRKHTTETMRSQQTFDKLEGAIAIDIMVNISRPKTVKRENVTVKPDVDKLARAILDSGTDAGLWRDDSQIIDLRIRKQYTTYAACVVMRIWDLEQTSSSRTITDAEIIELEQVRNA